MRKLCPICSKAMYRKDVSQAKDEFYFCPDHGCFVHFGFFSKLQGFPYLQQKIESSQPSPHPQGRVLRCVDCRSKMTHKTFSQAPLVEIDQCAGCRSLWFDDRELIQITKHDFRKGENPGNNPSQMKLEDIEAPASAFASLVYFGIPVFVNKKAKMHASFVTFVLLLVMLAMTKFGIRDESYFSRFAFDPADPFRNLGITFLTSLGMHRNWLSFAFNMYFFFICADAIEARKGFFYTLFLFLASGAFGMYLYSFSGSAEFAVGSRGAIAGLFAYYCLRFPHVRIHTFSFFHRYNFRYSRHTGFPVAPLFLFWLLTEISYSYFQNHQPHYWMQLGGALMGVGFFLFDDLENKNPEPNH